MSKTFTKFNAAVSAVEDDQDYLNTLTDLGIEGDWKFEEMYIDLDKIEAFQPVTNQEGVANIHMISGEKWSVEITDEVKELFNLK